MLKICELGCGHFVGGGGNRHAIGHCPPEEKPGDNRRARRRAKRRPVSTIKVGRGAPVPGTGSVSASSKEGRKKPVGA
jgi:hypothetical protein